MNLSSKCRQMLKLVSNASKFRHNHLPQRFCGTLSTRLRFYDALKPNKCLSSVPETHFRQLLCLSSSRSASSNSSSNTPTSQKDEEKVKPGDEFENLGLIARFKKMYKEYWYVLVPVHLATSAVWLGTFYYVSKSGMDIVAIMQSWNFSDTLIKPFRDSSMGHVAVAYLLYKIATPARYTVTLGATTVAIKHLVRLGYIKPVPSRAEMYQIYQDKKESVQTRVAEKQQELIEKRDALKEELIEKRDAMKEELMVKRDAMKEELETFKEDFRDSMKTVGTVSNPQPPTIPEGETETSDATKKSETTKKSDKETKKL
ncbi:uncharacterized protein C18orf19 homolog A [Culicoides brevitarsis]|uniref:uncharacterized protein C18orf19 homolog A n=1 Tax=Culicoides brevitarsis TaxID=469753 RepID=UPI00307B937B